MKATVNNHNGKAISQELIQEAVLLDEWIKVMEDCLEERKKQIKALLREDCTVQGGQYVASLETRNIRPVKWEKECEKLVGAEACNVIRQSYEIIAKEYVKIGRVGKSAEPTQIRVKDNFGNAVVIEKAA